MEGESKMNALSFDSTKLDESRKENLDLALSQIRYADIFQIKRNLGEKAHLHGKTIDSLFDITTLNTNYETREVLQFKDFQEFKSKFNHEKIVNHIRRMQDTIPAIRDKEIESEYNHILLLLEHFKQLQSNC